MKTLLAVLFIFLTVGLSAQTMDDKLSTIPEGTVLTLKSDHLIQPYEAKVALEVEDENYGVYNIVFTSKDKRRRMKAGTQFIVKDVVLSPNSLSIVIDGKIKSVFFGEIKKRDDLKISALSKHFDVEFPEIEDF